MEWNLTGGRKLLIGMIHCLPLPGTYGATATIDEVIARAVSDAKALERVGFDAVMIENEDLCLEPHMTKVQFSAISMVAQAVRSAVKLPLGLCCSGLNYEEALSIAKVVGGDFIRTPIFVDTVMNYNGIMTPCSGKIIRYRREISAEHVKIFADVQVKHYYMVNPEVDIATSAKWAQHQGADAVIVTGCSTGTETASSDLEKVKNSISIPVAVGSGVTEKNIAEKMRVIVEEDECNDTYGRIRMYQALQLKQPEGVHIPGERTVYRVMEEIGLNHRPKRKPNGITKADKEARKSDDLIKRDFTAEKPLEKCVTDMTEIKASDGKLYVSAIFDCYDLAVLGLAMDTNMKATLCEKTLDNAYRAYPMLRGAIIHSDRGTQYTSELYRKAISKYGILQSMNSAGGRCHDNARCESMWARFKEELLYGRYDTTAMTVEQLKTLIWRYFISYWNNRRICSANGGLPPMVKRQQYYDSLLEAA